MMYDDYLSFGGVEIANSARAKAYAESASCPVYWIKTEACENLPVALSHLPYTSETVYDSPWYDPANRDLSTRFFGVVVVSVKGLSDSSREISTIEGIKDGGVISGQRRGSRRARYRLALIARGADALEYGINWLSSKLDGQKCGQHGARCGTSDLQFFADCPPPMEFDYTFDPDPSRTVRNLFTNPNLVGTGTYATVAENLFTNPRLKGDGTWAEVRRNLCKNPYSVPGGTLIGLPNAFNPTLSRSVALPIPTPDGRTTGLRGSIPSGESPTHQIFSVYNLDGLSNISGVERSVGAWFMATAPGYSAYFIGDTPVALEPNEWKWVTTDTPVAGNVYTVAYIEKTEGSAGASDNGYVTGVTSVAGAIPPEAPFDGSTTPETEGDVIQPEDFRWRWLGAENASESVMEIERVAGLGGNNVIPGVSTWEGRPAARLVPIANSQNSYARFNIPPEAAPSGTLKGTLGMKNPIFGAGSLRGVLRVQPPVETAPPSLNAPGEYPMEVKYTSQGSGSFALLSHGGSQGSGDIWWTDIGLFAGNYPHETFNGESDPADTGVAQPEDFRIRWTGAVDNSTSVMEIETVAGLTGVRCIPGLSTRNGKPAVRQISTGGDLLQPNFMHLHIPEGARSGGTLMGTAYAETEAPQPPGARRALYVITPEQLVAPNAPARADTPLRGTFASVVSLFQARLYGNGSPVGSGDVWWTDIGLFAGDYTGSWFTGDFPSTPEPNDNPTIYSWEGEPNNSVSRREQGQWIATENPERHRGLVNEVTRFMHDVAVSSGPLLIEEYEKGGVNAAVVEVNFQSERGYIYGAPRELNLDAAELSSVNDVGINLIPNPRGRKKSTTDSVIARNAVTNPSFETNLTGWTETVGRMSRPLQELRARGDYSLKITTTELNAGAAHTIAAASRSSASRAVLGVWVALTSSGAKVPSSIELSVRSGSTVYASRTIPTPPANSGQYYTLDVEGVPTSGNVEIVVDARWTGGTTQSVSMYLDTVMFLQDG